MTLRHMYHRCRCTDASDISISMSPAPSWHHLIILIIFRICWSRGWDQRCNGYTGDKADYQHSPDNVQLYTACQQPVTVDPSGIPLAIWAMELGVFRCPRTLYTRMYKDETGFEEATSMMSIRICSDAQRRGLPVLRFHVQNKSPDWLLAAGRIEFNGAQCHD